MSRSMIFILIAAGAAGVWTLLMSRASRLVHPVVGAGIIEGSALLLVLLLVLRQRIDVSGAVTPLGALLLVLAGLCVLAVDYFSLRAYEMGMEISVGAPTISAGAILVPTVLGLLMGEGISVTKLLGIGLIGTGVLLLTRLSV